jgi:hypothetical protein
MMVKIFQDKPRLSGLTVLGYVIRKQPSWLYKLTQHNLIKELLKILKVRLKLNACLIFLHLSLILFRKPGQVFNCLKWPCAWDGITL